jgi:CRP/FNR family transcriptional regulator, cyclic AMP receptor protein
VKFELLAGLSDDDRRSVLARMTRRSFRKGETLFHEGDPGDSLHLIEKGRVAIRPSTPLGDVVTLAILGPGESFGEQALLAPDAKRTASAVALESVETRMLHRRVVDELRTTQPSIDRFLIEVLAGQVRRLSQRVLEALYDPADRRIVRRLAELAELYDEGESPIVIGLRQDDLATMAGTTRSTTNRVLQQLVESGTVTVRRGRLEVHDAQALRKGAD